MFAAGIVTPCWRDEWSCKRTEDGEPQVFVSSFWKTRSTYTEQRHDDDEEWIDERGQIDRRTQRCDCLTWVSICRRRASSWKTERCQQRERHHSAMLVPFFLLTESNSKDFRHHSHGKEVSEKQIWRGWKVERLENVDVVPSLSWRPICQRLERREYSPCTITIVLESDREIE